MKGSLNDPFSLLALKYEFSNDRLEGAECVGTFLLYHQRKRVTMSRYGSGLRRLL